MSIATHYQMPTASPSVVLEQTIYAHLCVWRHQRATRRGCPEQMLVDDATLHHIAGHHMSLELATTFSGARKPPRPDKASLCLIA
ncbi:hypothetical protein [Candidatus Chloroploca asiatica]|uniref:Uncharacterized protein n=1 Tax=Candidatus Chloroploca asiatica TaxID=1506545 RepID=A0A2H3KZF9_9CHLR|nr:hypothetical protein [Candidatus Chloroploca asiatica]PDV99421.1 hypothetical protein A9Q02_12305 [Candidatus Chloroploca asiatica]